MFDFDGVAGRCVAHHRLELQRPHAAAADVAEHLHRVQIARRAVALPQPVVDEQSPEAIGKRVCEQPRQAAERLANEFRELENAPFQRHGQRCDIQFGTQELRCVLEGRGGVRRGHADSADGSPP